VADRLPDHIAQAAGALRDLIAAVPAAQRDQAVTIARAGIRLGAELARGELLFGDDFESLRSKLENTVTGDRTQWQA